MRIRAVIFFLLSLVGLSLGCRSALSPNVDRNRAPETWITGAPMDTITTTVNGQKQPPQIPTIPIRYHMYWAGSDQDGQVVGFYWAVVETLPIPIEGQPTVPQLPGPRASQYHFTTKTDSIFTFDVSEFAPDREHAFYIYAVDDKGKADPTPARFIFNALDRFPPVPVFDDPVFGGQKGRATGKVWRVRQHGVPESTDTTTFIGDSLDLNDLGRTPHDTTLSNARIEFRWHADPATPGQPAVAYEYKLDEPTFVRVDSSVHSVSYNTGIGNDVTKAGTKIFYFKAIDAAGGARQVDRRFQVNKDPDTWFAGPDSNLVAFQGPGADSADFEQHRFLLINNWGSLDPNNGHGVCLPCSSPPLDQTLLGCDSLTLWPSERKQMKTFWEIYHPTRALGDNLYLHVEGDTVDMNSWVIVSNGGSDIDSPYTIDVQPNDPPYTQGCGNSEPARVLIPTKSPVGSPVGFRFQTTDALDPGQVSVSTPSESAVYPTFNAASSFTVPQVNGYMTFNLSGKIYLVVHAVDGDGGTDNRILDAAAAKALADRVDAGQGSANDIAMRSRVLTFYVNRSPYFLFGSGFTPPPPAYNTPAGTTYAFSDRVLHLFMPADDPDPFDRANPPPSPGQPSTSKPLRWQVTVNGTYTQGGVTRDTSFAAPVSFDPHVTIDLTAGGAAGYITGTHLTLDIQLCDCVNCESQPGSGRCIHQLIPADVPAQTAAAAQGPTGTNLTSHPGRSITP